jgi:hypothetical protein
VPDATVAADVEDQVVPLPTVGRVLTLVVDDVVRAQRPHQVHLAAAAHPGHLGPERLRDLHREAPHAPGGAEDEDVLAGLEAPRIAAWIAEPGHRHDAAASTPLHRRQLVLGGHRGRR